MRFGMAVPIIQGNAHYEFLDKLGPILEERGFESLWVPEHVVLFDEYESRYPYTADGSLPVSSTIGMVDPFVALSYVAATTRTLRLATGICLLPQRNPVYTARQVADLDFLSNGRFEFGIGIGWSREEYGAANVPWERRGARTDAYLDVMVSLWKDDVSSYEGPLYSLPPCRSYPKPKQQPHPRIHVGGESEAAMRRVAARGQGWYSVSGSPEESQEALARLDSALAAVGRTREEITVTIHPAVDITEQTLSRDLVERYEELGVDRIICGLWPAAIDDIERAADRMANGFPA